jgi:receptor protein-tyrosine kinase
MNDQTESLGTPGPDRRATLDAKDPVSDQEMREALLLLDRLSNETQTHIDELMKELQIRFSDAVLQSGVLSQKELDEALARIRQRTISQGQSLFERMMGSRVGRNEIVRYKGETLQPAMQLIIAHDPDNPRSETLRRLRTELLLRTTGRRGAGIFALLSPCAREGRSQLAAELAISFAQLDRKTLLVDGDLRRPSQHELFGADNEMGLAQALGGDAGINLHSVQGLPKMAVLTSGGQPPNPVELLHGSRFERMIADWRRSFEFVVIDTPPISEFSDGLTIASAAGNVLVLGRAKATTFAALKEMRRHLEPVHARIVGAVINSF